MLRTTSSILLPLLPSVAARPSAVTAETIERHLVAMGTELVLHVEAATRAQALKASERAVRAIEAAEARLSTWREDTELARLNRAPVGEAVELSGELAGELARVHALWRATDGAFDPGVGALVRAWGLRTGGRAATDEELRAALGAGGLASLELAGARATRRADVVLEEGAFGKGAGLDAALDALVAAGATAGRIDLGGQWIAFGEPVTLGVADPRARERTVATVTVERGSIATTGNSERSIVVAGERRSHVLDPRTGRLADDWGSVTVHAPDALTADALSTGLFVLGPDAALAFARDHEGIDVLTLEPTERGLRLRASEGWRDLRTVDPAVLSPSPSSPDRIR